MDNQNKAGFLTIILTKIFYWLDQFFNIAADFAANVAIFFGALSAVILFLHNIRTKDWNLFKKK